MKKILIGCFSFIFLIAIIFGSIYFIVSYNEVYKYILNGYYDKDEYPQENAFQDSTDYYQYYYKDNTDDKFKKSSNYIEVTENEIEKLEGYFNDFSNWMDAGERSDEYDFKNEYITPGDYFQITTKDGKQVGKAEETYYYNYTIFYYDIETHTLYRCHSNI